LRKCCGLAHANLTGSANGGRDFATVVVLGFHGFFDPRCALCNFWQAMELGTGGNPPTAAGMSAGQEIRDWRTRGFPAISPQSGRRKEASAWKAMFQAFHGPVDTHEPASVTTPSRKHDGFSDKRCGNPLAWRLTAVPRLEFCSEEDDASRTSRSEGGFQHLQSRGPEEIRHDGLGLQCWPNGASAGGGCCDPKRQSDAGMPVPSGGGSVALARTQKSHWSVDAWMRESGAVLSSGRHRQQCRWACGVRWVYLRRGTEGSIMPGNPTRGLPRVDRLSEMDTSSDDKLVRRSQARTAGASSLIAASMCACTNSVASVIANPSSVVFHCNSRQTRVPAGVGMARFGRGLWPGRPGHWQHRGKMRKGSCGTPGRNGAWISSGSRCCLIGAGTCCRLHGRNGFSGERFGRFPISN